MTTRRQFLTSASAAALSTSLFGANATGHIDAHVHVWPQHTDAFPLAEGFKPADMQPPSFTPEQLFAHCKPEGVTRIVLIQMSYYRFDNRYMLKAMADHPGTFGGVAIVDETQPDVVDKMKALAKQGVRGFRIYAGEKNLQQWLASDGMATMWKTAAKNGLAICPLINPVTLPLIDDMCERYPDTRVVIDHFARLGMKAPPTAHEVKALTALSRHEHTFVKTSAFYALGNKAAPYTDLGLMIRACRDTFGADRLMWASDCPFQVDPGHNYKDSIALIRDRLDFLSASDKTAMLRTTAERVFFH
jgi:predicted TIM-barrel fold metal-dependent hydrolase